MISLEPGSDPSRPPWQCHRSIGRPQDGKRLRQSFQYGDHPKSAVVRTPVLFRAHRQTARPTNIPTNFSLGSFVVGMDRPDSMVGSSVLVRDGVFPNPTGSPGAEASESGSEAPPLSR